MLIKISAICLQRYDVILRNANIELNCKRRDTVSLSLEAKWKIFNYQKTLRIGLHLNGHKID